jgi:hypothetical protein
MRTLPLARVSFSLAFIPLRDTLFPLVFLHTRVVRCHSLDFERRARFDRGEQDGNL